MLLIVIRILYAFTCAGATYVLTANSPNAVDWDGQKRITTFLLLLLGSQVVTVVDILIPKKRIDVISSVYFGLLVGVLLSFLSMLALSPVLISLGLSEWTGWLNPLLTLALSYVSISVLIQTKDDFRFIIPYVEFSRELKGGRPLILDTSALIDGRIADVVETKMLDAKMIVPSIVLKEVQDIADSADKSRRTRGRRGLDVLSKLQSIPDAEVEVHEVAEETDGKSKSVDQRLVKLAKELGGRIVTSDFNLNKVASVQGVDVINLNDVAAALRPRFLPGDALRVKVIREGEGAGQGVGYLDDGTMVVIEQGMSLIGQEVEVIVTSVLQSSAGRMIFARPAGVEPPPSHPHDRHRPRS